MRGWVTIKDRAARVLAAVSSQDARASSPMAWSLADIADALHDGLRRREAALRIEQAVVGLDGLDELRLHPVVAGSLEEAGFGVFREARYPRDRAHRRRSVGERCDVVLTPRGLRLREPDAVSTLFDPPDAVGLDEAFWLEVKAVPQFLGEGPNDRYAAELLEPLRRDVRKLAADEGIRHAALLLILFTADETTATHDLDAWERRAMDRGILFEPPCVRHSPIVDRLGNRVCTVALYGIVREGG